MGAGPPVRCAGRPTARSSPSSARGAITRSSACTTSLRRRCASSIRAWTPTPSPPGRPTAAGSPSCACPPGRTTCHSPRGARVNPGASVSWTSPAARPARSGSPMPGVAACFAGSSPTIRSGGRPATGSCSPGNAMAGPISTRSPSREAARRCSRRAASKWSTWRRPQTGRRSSTARIRTTASGGISGKSR